MLKLFKNSVADFSFCKKKVVSSAYAIYRKSLLQTFKLLILAFLFILMKAISKAFIMHNSWFFNKSLIHLIKSFLSPYFSRVDAKSKRLTESKAFSLSTISKIPSICNKSVISTISGISLPPSLINLLF